MAIRSMIVNGKRMEVVTEVEVRSVPMTTRSTAGRRTEPSWRPFPDGKRHAMKQGERVVPRFPMWMWWRWVVGVPTHCRAHTTKSPRWSQVAAWRRPVSRRRDTAGSREGRIRNAPDASEESLLWPVHPLAFDRLRFSAEVPRVDRLAAGRGQRNAGNIRGKATRPKADKG